MIGDMILGYNEGISYSEMYIIICVYIYMILYYIIFYYTSIYVTKIWGSTVQSREEIRIQKQGRNQPSWMETMGIDWAMAHGCG